MGVASLRSVVGAGVGLALALWLAPAASVLAQDPGAAPPPPEAGAAPSDTVNARRSYNAGGAFLRSLLVPGWGQAAVGSPNRGGFYFAVEGISAWMILKTSRIQGDAERILDLRRAEAEARIVAEGETDPFRIERLVEDDEVVEEATELFELRTQQKEDWIAFALFMLFLGGADAFVAAHLADFPEALETGIRASARHGRGAGGPRAVRSVSTLAPSPARGRRPGPAAGRPTSPGGTDAGCGRPEWRRSPAPRRRRSRVTLRWRSGRAGRS